MKELSVMVLLDLQEYVGLILSLYIKTFVSLYISVSYTCSKDISFHNEQDRLYALSTIKPTSIKEYLKNIYADNCEMYEIPYDKKYVNINCNGTIIKLDSNMLIKYSNMYNNTYKYYTYDEININIDIDETTARCIEDLINNENKKALVNATNILAYHAVVDYLDINIKTNDNVKLINNQY